MHAEDQHLRDQALDPQCSFLVQAPAGSGKTALLTQRLLVLLAHAEVPEEIIAITFTKKAAAEMRDRVYTSLLSAKEACPSAPHAKKTWQLASQVLKRDHAMGWQLLENVNRLRITTIDSLCASITTKMPLLSKMGANVTVTDNPLGLYQEAVQSLWLDLAESVAWKDALGQVLAHLDNRFDRLSTLLVKMLATREQWLTGVLHTKNTDISDDIKASMEACLLSIINDHHARLLDCLASAQSMGFEETLYQAFNNLWPAEYPSLARFKEVLREANEQGFKTWRRMALILLNKKGKKRLRLTAKEGFLSPSEARHAKDKAQYQQHKAAGVVLVSALEAGFVEQIAGFSRLPPSTISQEAWLILDSLLTLLPIVVAHLRLVFSRHRQVDFNEISLCAANALGEEGSPTDLALALDCQVRHLLVDEFQDTSSVHYRLLCALTAGWEPDDGRTLFFVGDPMQSIYRFRQADVRLFLQVKSQGLGHIPLTFLALRCNFRSDPPVVAWINQHFSVVFPEANDILLGAISYHAATPMSSHDNTCESGVSFLLTENAQEEANATLDYVQQHLNTNSDESIAILVRSRAHLAYILPLLNQANIAYCAVDIEPLADKLAIRDVVSLTYALTHLGDALSWFCVLRAPWCGLSLVDLACVRKFCHESTVLAALKDPACFEQLSAYAKQRMRWFIPIMSDFIKQRAREPLALWVKKCWFALGAELSLEVDTEYDDVMRYFDLLGDISQSFSLPSRPILEAKLNQLYAKSIMTSHARVFVMTIHKSKGLEFDRVVILGMNRRSRQQSQPLVLFDVQQNADDEETIIMAPIKAADQDQAPLYDYLFSNEQKRMSEEVKRLLYVALTRAKKQVCLVATVEENDDNQLKAPSAESFLGHLWPSVSADFNAQWQAHGSQGAAALQQAETLPFNSAVSSALKRIPFRLLAPYTSTMALTEGENQPDGFDEHNLKSRQIGILVHFYLAMISKEGPSLWSEARIKDYEAHMIQQCRQAYMNEVDIPDAVSTIQTALINTIEDSVGQWILSPHRQHQSEYVLYSLHYDRPREHIVDRTFIDEAGVRWIIDYKTATPHQDQDTAAFLHDEKAQYLAQLQRYATIFDALDQHRYPITLALYFPFCQQMIQWPGCHSSKIIPAEIARR